LGTKAHFVGRLSRAALPHPFRCRDDRMAIEFRCVRETGSMGGGGVWRWVCLAVAVGLWLVSAGASLSGGAAATLFALTAGSLLGGVLAGSQRHPCRRFAAVPFGAALLFVSLVWTALAPASWSAFALGLAGGLLAVPLAGVVKEWRWRLHLLLFSVWVF